MSVTKIQEKVQQLVQEIEVRPGLLEIALPEGANDAEGVRLSDSVYYYIFRERGNEMVEYTTTDPDEMVKYVIIHRVVYVIAFNYAIEHATPDADQRRIRHQKEIALLEIINPAWAQEIKKQHELETESMPYQN